MLGWILIGLFVFIVLLAATPVRISLYYGRVSENDHLVVEVSAWFHLIRRKYELPVVMVKQTENGPELKAKVETVRQEEKTAETVRGVGKDQLQKWKQIYQVILERFHDFKPVLQQFAKQIRCERLEWHTVLGTGEAAETGALLGAVWGVKSILIALFSHAISLRSMPRLSVQPVWNQPVIRTQARCILHFFLGHVLVMGLRLLFRLKKGRVHKWETSPSGA
ncbi:DUF2953 domain-containing protein [Brevibacillus borstelensis]|uniref:DUF2953 domain-containing protein n=1 Tax=Brevibacillus borstelensis TaxID=45462 RepID=UPI0004698594|nr:DUF2953 domain-containing protein [Brevibacillus borstelensis]MED1853561.1 DUF2953 domain-containing protein [Brevibacillus borstelensis]